MPASLKQLRSKVRGFAISLPETSEHFPWGERVVKVNNKVFAFLGQDMDPAFSLGVKLTASHSAALATPSVARMRYGLGRTGWVSAKFEGNAHPTFEQLRAWVLESYRAVAPKNLAAPVEASARGAKAAKKARPQSAARPTAARRTRTSAAERAPAKKRVRKP